MVDGPVFGTSWAPSLKVGGWATEAFAGSACLSRSVGRKVLGRLPARGESEDVVGPCPSTGRLSPVGVFFSLVGELFGVNLMTI